MKIVSLLLVISSLFFFDTASGQMQMASTMNGEIREKLVQKALSFRRNEEFNAAIQQLDSILIYQPTDAPILLFKGDLLLQARRFSEATLVYKKLLPLDFEATITRINLSYALFMSHHPSKALKYAEEAWSNDLTNTSAIVNYFNALLWNIKTKEAGAFLQQQDTLLLDAQKLVLKARLYTTSGQYQAGLKYYDSLVKTYPDKYYVQEYAEVLLGKKEIKQSSATMLKAKGLFSENEYKTYTNKLKATEKQNAGTEMVYFKDVAGNIRIENSIWWQQQESKKYRFRASAGYATLTSSAAEKTISQFAHIRVDERWSRAWSGETDVHVQSIRTHTGEQFAGITGQQVVRYQPNDRKMIGFSLGSDILNFTPSLLGKNIRNHSLGYLTHIMLDGKTGFYSQGSAGVLTDDNKRYHFFGSIYRLLRTEPTLKAGVNFSALHYSDSSIKTYFSPNRYLNTEVFADYSTPLPGLSKFYCQLQAAAGVQKIEADKWEPSLRFQTEIGIRLQKLEAMLKYQTSTVAAANGTGYQFNWYTARVLFRW
jgi:tetratricopeptide (TPR) repeat protein